MIVKIVCASTNSFSKLYNKDDDEFIIGCDGGCKVLGDLNINYDLALGDFDSFSESLINPNITKMKFKSEKDESDLELALDYALKLDPEKILIYNATGKRIDHLLASINLLKKYKNNNIIILDEDNEISVSSSAVFLRNYYKYISFFSIAEETVISLRGFKYNLDNYHLSQQDSLCLSNEITTVGHLITNKEVLVIKSR